MKSSPISLMTSAFFVDKANSLSVSYVSSVKGLRISIGWIPTPEKNPLYRSDNSSERRVDSIVVPAEITARTPTRSARSRISPTSASVNESR